MIDITSNFVRNIFGNTELPIHFCSLGNDRDGKHHPKMLDTRNPDDLAAFVAKHDVAERGMFYCVSTLKAGSHKRNKGNVAEIPMLYADIDLKDVEESIEEIEFKLKTRLPKPPTIVVRSGNGVHAIWLLKEAIDLQSEGVIDRIEVDLRLLADVVGGDHQVCEVARVLRLPGTHNTKFGEWKEVTFDGANHPVYELDDLEEWLGEQSPIILRKERPKAATAGQAIDLDPYLAYAKENGIKTPIDVKARLDAMMYMGGGEADVHATQLAVSSSLLNSGVPDEEVVETLLAATKAAAGDYGKRWNWRIEERTIRKMVEGWHKKYTAKPKTTEPLTVNKEVSKPAPVVNSNISKSATVTALKPKTKPLPTPEDNDGPHIKVGTAVLGVLRSNGDDLIFTEKASWLCRGGLWRMMTDTGWLNVEIEKAIKAMNFASTLKLVNETRGWIQRQDSTWRDEVPWDQHGMVPTLSGLINPRTLEIEALRPDHYATWRIEAEYAPAAQCPWWLQMLSDVFYDRDDDVRSATIAVIQELLGAALIDDKPKEITRALVLLGGSNFGKSGLLEVLGGLFGQEQNATPIETLEGTHGLMPFAKRTPWVLHEAFDQRKWHFSANVKAIISGEFVGLNIKNGPFLSIKVRAPIFWGTNHPPQFKEATKAIINRLVVIECRREFLPERPVGAGVEAAKRGFSKPSNLVLAEEMPGVLAWAVVGLQRALARGHLTMTEEIIATGEAIRDDSNMVAGFLNECIHYDPDRRVSIPDFCLAFSAWWIANRGENRQPPSNDSIGKNMIAMADSMVAINAKELRDKTRRYYAGIVLNEEGLAFHRSGYENSDLRGKTANATEPKEQINTHLPPAWDQKPSIIAMQKRQMTLGDDTSKGQVSSSSSVINGTGSKCHLSPSVTQVSSHVSSAKITDTSMLKHDPHF